jgi:putative ABC transport system permease protein
MYLLALKMLVSDKAKYIGLLLGLSFAAFIISQQSAILVGIIERTFGFITDTSQPNIWVMDPTVQYIDDVKPLKDTALSRVKGVDGVDWAVPLYKGMIQARLSDGTFQNCILLGIDDATLIGGPPVMVKGKLESLRMGDAVIVDRVGAEGKLAHKTTGGETIPLGIGSVLELNDHRAYVTGICEVSRTFQSNPVIYTTYGRATSFVPSQRKLLSFVLAHSSPGISPEEVCARITRTTGLAAHTGLQMRRLTIDYYMRNTGIFVNFGVAIFLGFIIGSAIAGQTLYNFTIDNIRYFGVFKAMGTDNKTLIGMVLLQALFVSLLGWGIGVGCAALFGIITKGTELSFSLPLPLYLGSLISILLISMVSAAICMRRVVKVDPAIVFKA